MDIDYIEKGVRKKLDYLPEDFFNTDKYLIFSGKSDCGNYSDLVRLPKGSWDILDALVPRILWHIKGSIVEVGMGESTEIFAQHAVRADIPLYSCDLQMGGMFKVFDSILYDKHECFIGRSEDFMLNFHFNEKPAIVFLDGEHSYKAVKAEVDFFLSMLKEGGVLFMHDTFPKNEEQTVVDKNGRKPGDVYRMRQELERMPDVDVFTWPYSALQMGLTMVMKHAKDRPYWRENGRNAAN